MIERDQPTRLDRALSWAMWLGLVALVLAWSYGACTGGGHP